MLMLSTLSMRSRKVTFMLEVGKKLTGMSQTDFNSLMKSLNY